MAALNFLVLENFKKMKAEWDSEVRFNGNLNQFSFRSHNYPGNNKSSTASQKLF